MKTTKNILSVLAVACGVRVFAATVPLDGTWQAEVAPEAQGARSCSRFRSRTSTANMV